MRVNVLAFSTRLKIFETKWTAAKYVLDWSFMSQKKNSVSKPFFWCKEEFKSDEEGSNFPEYRQFFAQVFPQKNVDEDERMLQQATDSN